MSPFTAAFDARALTDLTGVVAAGNVGSQFVDLYLDDENDNAPLPYTVPNPCIFMENTDPANLPTCEIRAFDRDSKMFGPPFRMSIGEGFADADKVEVEFLETLDNGNGGMTVRALKRFDRETTKRIEIPIRVTDVGGNSATRSVFVIIGDENDNPMSDGSVHIDVYSYEGQLQSQSIGRVYVSDLDDWDLPHKTFGLAERTSYFTVDEQGDIVIQGDTPPGTYSFKANVHDNERQEQAVGTVTVSVYAFPKLAFDNQAAIRIYTGSRNYEDSSFFIRGDSHSPREAFIRRLAQRVETLSGKAATVDVFSIQRSEFEPSFDVRFTVQAGGQYLSKTAVEGIIASDVPGFEEAVQGQIRTVGIDMCQQTRCDNGCQTVHQATHVSLAIFKTELLLQSGVVVAANTTVLVGINSTSSDECVCPIQTAAAACQPGYCYNAGICHNLNPGAVCECRKDLPGHRCQGNTRRFHGEGYAWFKALPACTSLNISFEFKT